MSASSSISSFEATWMMYAGWRQVRLAGGPHAPLAGNQLVSPSRRRTVIGLMTPFSWIERRSSSSATPSKSARGW